MHKRNDYLSRPFNLASVLLALLFLIWNIDWTLAEEKKAFRADCSLSQPASAAVELELSKSPLLLKLHKAFQLNDPKSACRIFPAWSDAEVGLERFIEAYAQKMKEQMDATEALWKVVLNANPDMAPTEAFFRVYAVDAIAILGNLNNFQSVVEAKQAFACDGNLLCDSRTRIVPGFRIGQRVTPIDLIRYLRTSTCFGFLPDKEHQNEFLRRLENILKVADLQAAELLPVAGRNKGSDNHFVLYDLANMRNEKGQSIVVRKDFPRIHALRQRAGADRGVDRPDRPLEPIIEQSAREACRRAYGPPPYRR